MKFLPLLLAWMLLSPACFAQMTSTWEDPTMLGILEEAMQYIDVGGENNLDQNGIQLYFKGKFNKQEFDQAFRQTSEYGWDTVVYHYLSALYFVAHADSVSARQECYKAGLTYGATSSANRNVLSRFGLNLDRINHLREYLDLGKHRSNKSIGFEGQEVKGYTGYTDDGLSTVPSFPWPPPRATTDCELPRNLFGAAATLGEVDAKVSYALSTCGYFEKSYFKVPGGFALVTRIEQFNNDGTSKSGNDRWNVSLKPNSFALSEYLQALFWGRKGKYRLLVFIVTDQPFNESNQSLTEGEGQNLLRTGSKFLPESLTSQPFSGGHRCFALVYEFELTEALTEPRFLKSGTCPGKIHMEKAGILSKIK